ncbi:MAG: hypothetical protein E6J90_12640 [Deltaproteobacteria bacterium]|nr:MAG: hypothetical protein E6J91_51135 [Deltaproteobacteria bacterium]TMQ22351.1 MAG: hypothetical protein E6J90_12640 [Deltaproteobacteria bacterium]
MLVLGAIGGCKDRRDSAPSSPPVTAGDAAMADANLEVCRAAAARAASLPGTRRAQALIDACQPCGSWQPLLDWNTPAASGGPSRAAIEQALVACHAFCEPNAKQRFLGTLDAARGQDTRGPWRHLGEICKGAVSALPDTRFMGAPYFALDRISRALGAANPAPAIELPLPALSVSGVGFDLPPAPASPAAVDAGPPALSVDANQILLGALPVATLSASGIAVSADYPGTPIEPRRLAAALAERPGPWAVLAPHALAAARVAQVVAAAGGHELRLAVAVPGPGGWSVPGALPIALTARPADGARIALGAPGDAIAAARAADLQRTPTITVDAAATVDGLAAVLAALAAREVKTVAVVATTAALSKP